MLKLQIRLLIKKVIITMDLKEDYEVKSRTSAIYTAVATVMSQHSGTNQDIRVYAEEGLIVEKVSKGINQYVKQTGSLPFVIPI